MGDSPKDHQEDFQERHLGSEEIMRECGDRSRAQKELRKKTEKALFSLDAKRCTRCIHPKDVRRARGSGRGQRGPYL